MFIKNLAYIIAINGLLCGSLAYSGDVNALQKNIEPVDIVVQDARIVLATGVSSYGDNAITGKVCVVTSFKQLNKISAGDIVVTSAINSRWYSGLAIAGGIITEKGSGGGNDALALGKKLAIPVIVGAKGIIKKVVDGQIVTLDPIVNNVYHVAHSELSDIHTDILMVQQKNNGELLHEKLAKEDKRFGLNLPLLDGENKEHALKNEEKKDSVLHQVRGVSPLQLITKVKVLADKHAIGSYIVDTQKDMDRGRWWGKTLARAAGISDKAFDAMPVEDFVDSRKMKHKVDPKRSVSKLASEDAINYINQGKDVFMGKYFNPKRKKNEIKSDLAEFLHDRLVDHLDVSEKDKAKVKKEPSELKKLLEDGKIEEEWYEELTCRNLAIDYYVHKEIDQK